MNQTEPASPTVVGTRRYLEIAIPLLSFGCTLIGMLLWGTGIRIDFQYFAIGCVIASGILAYLAWTRPRKDIVALSTPIYALIFFLVPSDYQTGIILQLLCAAGLTILLFRLNRRFADIPQSAPGVHGGPVAEYLVLIRQHLPSVPPVQAHMAALVFIRFAQGDYEIAGRMAADLEREAGQGTLATAASIVAEQTDHLEQGLSFSEEFLKFTPADGPVLFHDTSRDLRRDQEYGRVLENALLLLYAIGMETTADQEILGAEALWKFAESLASGN